MEIIFDHGGSCIGTKIVMVLMVIVCISSPSASFAYKQRAGGLLTDNAIIEQATFVDIDFGQFPVLPEYSIPSNNVIFVSVAGNDHSGDGSPENPYLSITKALSEAYSGHTVIVRGGQYLECNGWVHDHRALVIDKDDITLMAFPGEEVEILPFSDTTHTGIELSGNNAVIRGISLMGFSTGILFDGVQNPVISNTVIADIVIGLSESQWSTGITLQVSTVIDRLLVYNTGIFNAGLIGIHCGPGFANNWRIEKTKILMNSLAPGSGADAFAAENGDNILLINSEFAGASADGIDTKATRVVVFNCFVHNVGRNGIKFWYGGDIINTIIVHTGADASISAGGDRIRLLHSFVGYHNYNADLSYNMVYGYGTEYDMVVEIINSAVFNTSGGAYFSENTELTISHSLFYDMQNGRILEHGNNTVYTEQGLSDYGEGNLVHVPGLDDALYPLPGSILINAGMELQNDYPAIDYSGNPRIIQGSPDIGPHETRHHSHYVSKAVMGLNNPGFAGTYIWQYDLQKGSFWNMISENTALKAIAGDITGDYNLEIIAYFADKGLWAYSIKSGWSILLGPQHNCGEFIYAKTSGNDVGELIMSIEGLGVYIRYIDGSFQRLTHVMADKLVAANFKKDTDDLFLTFSGITGLYRYDFSLGKFSRILMANPLHIAVSDINQDGTDELVCAFENAGTFIAYYIPDDKILNFTRITRAHPGPDSYLASATIKEGGSRQIIFSIGNRTNYYDHSDSSWYTLIMHPFKKMLSGRFTGNYYDDMLYLDNAGRLFLYRGDDNAWENIAHGLSISAMSTMTCDN